MYISKKRDFLNLFLSSGSQIILLALGLIIPRIILTHYGSDTNGLTGTITNIFTCLALLESGISVAARNALYNPIANNDKEGISFVMSVAKRYYRDITLMYAVIVVVMAFVLPFIINTGISYWTVFFLVLFEGMSNVISFFYICTWSCVICASGKSYVNDFFQLVQRILCYVIKIILALNYTNIAVIQGGFFVVSIVTLFVYYAYMKKNYDWIDYKVAPRSAKLPDRWSYVVSEIAHAIFSSADMIIISIFMSTNSASVYAVYSLIYASLNSVLNSVYNAFRFRLGQKYHGNRAEFLSTYDTFNSLFLGGMTALICVCNLLALPFVKLYTEGVHDINYINPAFPVLFGLVQVISWSRTVSGDIIGIAGRQRQAVKINLIEMFTNVILSFVFVNIYGVVGVLFATVIALPLKVVYCTYISENIILQRKPLKTILILVANYLLFIVTSILGNIFVLDIHSYLEFALCGILFSLVFFLVTVLLNAIVNKAFRTSIVNRFRLNRL